MRKLIMIMAIGFFAFIGCNEKSDSSAFESEKLIGKYDVDLTPIVAESIKSSENDDGWAKMGKGLAGMALASVDIKLSFYKGNKGVMYLKSMGIFSLVAGLDDKSEIKEFQYKVENDSILYMKKSTDKDYKKWAIVKKYSDNYDYLRFKIVQEGEEQVYFDLSKIDD
jgi:hypothetical protein